MRRYHGLGWADVRAPHLCNKVVKFFVVQSPLFAEFAHQTIPQFGLNRFALGFGANQIAKAVEGGCDAFDFDFLFQSGGHLFRNVTARISNGDTWSLYINS